MVYSIGGARHVTPSVLKSPGASCQYMITWRKTQIEEESAHECLQPLRVSEV
jgi:hypothetical protein